MNLTSNTKYGKQVKEKYFNGFIDLVTYRELRDKYDDFLDSEIKLGDFVPTSLDGVVLEKPGGYDLWIRGVVSDYPEYLEYQEALDRVLFEGVDILYNGLHITFYTKDKKIFDYWKSTQHFEKGNLQLKTIEDLTIYNLTLSPNALKQLGL